MLQCVCLPSAYISKFCFQIVCLWQIFTCFVFQYGFEQILFRCLKCIETLYCFCVPSAYILIILCAFGLYIKNPYMRLVRKARLEASELLSHTPYMSQSGSKICTHCQSNNTEDLHHFFFQCTAYNSQRVEFLERINPILRDLGLPLNDVSSVLGFPQGPASKHYFSSNKCLREQLYLETCRYMRLLQRFSYV